MTSKGLLFGTIVGAALAPVMLFTIPLVGLLLLLPGVLVATLFGIDASDLIHCSGSKEPGLLFFAVTLVNAPVGASLGALVGLLVDRWRRPRKHHGAPQCPQCGYNLTGNVSGRCPECGTPRPGERLGQSSDAADDLAAR